MKKSLRVALTLLSVVTLNSAFALTLPRDCPDTVEIKAVSVSSNVLKINNVWVAGRRDQTYGTPDHWTFLIANIHAKNAMDAYRKATRAVESVTFQAGPLPVSNNRLMCTYSTVEGYTALAVTPAIGLREAANIK